MSLKWNKNINVRNVREWSGNKGAKNDLLAVLSLVSYLNLFKAKKVFPNKYALFKLHSTKPDWLDYCNLLLV